MDPFYLQSTMVPFGKSNVVSRGPPMQFTSTELASKGRFQHWLEVDAKPPFVKACPVQSVDKLRSGKLAYPLERNVLIGIRFTFVLVAVALSCQLVYASKGKSKRCASTYITGQHQFESKSSACQLRKLSCAKRAYETKG